MKIIKTVGLVKHASFHVYLAATQAALDKMDEATATVARFQRMKPGFRLSKWHVLKAYKSEEIRQRVFELGIKAGIPE